MNRSMTPSLERYISARQADWVAIGCVALFIRLAFWFVEGTRVVGDASFWTQYCGEFSLVGHVASFKLLYSGYSLPYCGFLAVPGTTIDMWVLLQLLFSAFSCVLLYEIGRSLMNRYAGYIAGLALAGTYQGFHYITRPQSQLIFASLFVVLLWTITVYRSNPTRRNRGLLFVCMGYVALTRPNGVAIVGGFLMLDLLFRDPRYRLDLLFSRPINIAVLGILGGFAFLHFYTLKSVFLPIYFLSRGIIVTGHITYPFVESMTGTGWSFVLDNLHHIVAMAILRGVWFFIPILPGWSLAHLLVNLATLAPLTVGALVAIPDVIRRKEELASLCLPPIVMTVLIVMVLWVPGPRKFLGPIIAVYGLLTGYLLTEHPLTRPLRNRLSSLGDELADR